MKLFFLIDIFGVGGKERRCLQLMKGLIEVYGCDIHLVLFDDIIGYPEIYKLNVKIHVLGRKTRKDFSVAYKLFKLIKTTKPDIVLSWSLMSSFWLNLLHIFYRFNYICAYVADSNKPPIFSLGNLARLMSYISAKYIIGNSVIGLLEYRAPKSKSVLIYNGFDFSRIDNLTDPEQVKLSLGLKKSQYVVTMVGRMTAAKDFHTFIQAAKLVLKERNDTDFLAVGDGPLLENFKKQLSMTDAEYIKFIGYRQNVEEIISATNICVLCSPSEGISNFILESMALGKPVVATNTGGTPEIVIDGENGYLVNNNNISELKDKLISLLNDENRRIELGENGKVHARTKFSLEKMTKQYYELFYSTIKAPLKNK